MRLDEVRPTGLPEQGLVPSERLLVQPNRLGKTPTPVLNPGMSA
jgi:hypothetical protein